MAPAQPCVDYNSRQKMGFLTNADEKGLRLINCEDHISGMEAYLQKHTKVPEVVVTTDSMEVDIIECANNKNIKLFENEDPDATEYSSSFANTESETGNLSGFSEAEVESRFLGDNNNLESHFDPFNGLFPPMRKKKVTNHWLEFIRPLMWRCKWTEVKINQLKSRESNYARKLAEHDLQKPLELDQSTLEGFVSKSFPISRQFCRTKAMKRRKRKKIENTIDVASYMSRHNLFSYFENKKSDLDGNVPTDDFENPVFTDQNALDTSMFDTNDDQSFLEFNGGENSLEGILLTIERANSRVQILKTQLGDIMSKHAGKFSSSENLSLLDTQTTPTGSAGNDEIISRGGNILEYDIGGGDDLVIPENGILGSLVPDITESTEGLLSAGGVTLPKPHVGDSCETILDNMLIHNQTAEVESSIVIPLEQSTNFNFPKNKRKRGERKPGPGGWSMKSSGVEADS